MYSGARWPAHTSPTACSCTLWVCQKGPPTCEWERGTMNARDAIRSISSLQYSFHFPFSLISSNRSF